MIISKRSTTAIVTIVSNNYLHFARTMLQSAKRYHTDYALYCVIVDRDLSHAKALSAEFEAISFEKLSLPLGEEFLFQYSILELNTAVKPWAIQYLFERGHENVIYVDPDIYFYGPMSDVEVMLATHSDIVLTPHLLAPVTDDKQPSELDIRRAGAYNFGFCALRDSTNIRNFLRWWQSKLTRDCVNDADRGLFVDQSWIDLVPGLFENVSILRHKGYNVAYWNIAQRPLKKVDKNGYFVDDDPLIFFHFSGLDPSNPATFSKHQDRFTVSTVGPAKDLVVDYVNAVKTNGYSNYSKLEYSFGRFTNGERIPDIFRNLYRQSSALRERMGQKPHGNTLRPIPKPGEPRSPEAAQRIPGSLPEVNADSPESAALLPGYSQLAVGSVEPSPFACAFALCDPWPEISCEGVAPTNAMMALWNVRHDVQSEFPLNSAGSIIAYYKWFIVFPLGAQHYSASVISHHVAAVKHFDEQAKIHADALSAARNKGWPGNEQRVHALYTHILDRTPDEKGFHFYSELCKTDGGFVRAWGEIGLSDESKKNKFLWLRMLKALAVAIYKTDKRTTENVDKSGSQQTEATEQSYVGVFPVEGDVATQGAWATDKVAIPISARPGDRIRLEGIYFPESIAKQTGSGESTISLLLRDEEIHSTQLTEHGDFAVECLVPEFRGAAQTVLVIESNKIFVPKSIGAGDDERKLAWRMKKLIVGDNSVFDCARPETFPESSGNPASTAVAGVADFGFAKLAYSGFFWAEPDSEELGVWVSANVVVPVVPVQGETIRLSGAYFPESIAKQTGNGQSTLRFFLGGEEVHSAILSNHGDFTVNFSLPKLNEDDTQLHIQCSKTFVPKTIGESDDDRILSWRMKKLIAGRITVFDCARQNFATSNRRFVPRMMHAPDFAGSQVKLFAFYMPQFSPFPVDNTQWRGKIVDWADVSNAMPQYADHHQPQLPVELGFYDYRTAGVLTRQVALAKQYGIAGFCFHYYWSAGKPLADQPPDRFLADSSLDFEFCIFWDNGKSAQNQNAVKKVVHESAGDDNDLIDSLASTFSDARYRRIDEKPILIVSNALLLPDAAASVSWWRARATELELPGLYLIASVADDTIDLRIAQFDAVVVVPPAGCSGPVHDITSKLKPIYPKFDGHVYDYCDPTGPRTNLANLGLSRFEAVMPSWDNEAIAPGTATSFFGTTPEGYAKRLSGAIVVTSQSRPAAQLLFINAWNAWGEGAHLEADQRYGYGYLHATASALLNELGAQNVSAIAAMNKAFAKRNDAVLIAHIYYEDLIDVIFDSYLTALATQCDLIVTVNNNVSINSLKKIKRKFENCFIVQTANQGRDIRPFIIAYRMAHELGYSYACKIHTKKSLQRLDGEQWRTQLLDSLLRSSDNVAKILKQLEGRPSIGLLAPCGALYDLALPDMHSGNIQWLDSLLIRLHEQKMIGEYAIKFPAGSMYWFRMSALSQLLDDGFVSLSEFELEAGQVDGTLAHALERMIGLLPTCTNYEIHALSH